MRTKKPLALRIFIWICVIFMALSLIGVYVVYMFAPKEEVGENNDGTIVTVDGSESVNTGTTADAQVIIPEIDSENPDDTAAPILFTEDGEVDEMDRMVEVQLENGETELVRQGDLGDAIQIN